jgi:hypothetical protein
LLIKESVSEKERKVQKKNHRKSREKLLSGLREKIKKIMCKVWKGKDKRRRAYKPRIWS